jgi:hypothetical protein
MGLFSSITSALGIGGGGGASSVPMATFTPAKFGTGKLQEGEDLLLNKAKRDITGVDIAGQAGINLNKQRLSQDIASNQAANQGAIDTASANAGMFGLDRGALSRISQAGLVSGAEGTQNLLANASNQNLATTQNNLQGQIDQKNFAENNIMQTLGVIPSIKNAQEEVNAGGFNRTALANQQGQIMANQAAADRQGGLMSGLFSLGGAAAGAYMGGGLKGAALGAQLGGAGASIFNSQRRYS